MAAGAHVALLTQWTKLPGGRWGRRRGRAGCALGTPWSRAFGRRALHSCSTRRLRRDAACVTRVDAGIARAPTPARRGFRGVGYARGVGAGGPAEHWVRAPLMFGSMRPRVRRRRRCRRRRRRRLRGVTGLGAGRAGERAPGAGGQVRRGRAAKSGVAIVILGACAISLVRGARDEGWCFVRDCSHGVLRAFSVLYVTATTAELDESERRPQERKKKRSDPGAWG